MRVILKNDKGYTKQYEVHGYVQSKLTIITLCDINQPLLEIPNLLLTPQNVKQKLSLYLTLM
jgi:hypothetical protein